MHTNKIIIIQAKQYRGRPTYKHHLFSAKLARTLLGFQILDIWKPHLFYLLVKLSSAYRWEDRG